MNRPGEKHKGLGSLLSKTNTWLCVLASVSPSAAGEIALKDPHGPSYSEVLWSPSQLSPLRPGLGQPLRVTSNLVWL